MNPILPNRYFIPDVEARQWADGRLYIYGSQDKPGTDAYCSNEYRVFSSADLKTRVKLPLHMEIPSTLPFFG